MRSKKAFTLIELLIVVAIIAILAAIAVPNFLMAQTRAKVSRVASDMRTISMGLESYHVDHNTYINPWYNGRGEAPPPEQETWTGYWLVLNGEGGNSGGGWQLTTPIAYLTAIPDDPFWIKHGQQYYGVAFHRCSVLYWGVLKANLPWGPPPWDSFGKKYILESCGPDIAQHGFGDPDSYGNFIYDPTNGVVSGGDIWYVDGDGFLGSLGGE